MDELTFLDSVKEEARTKYITIFKTEWPLWVGGFFLAFLSIMMILWARPWGVAAGIRNWGDWFFYLIGLHGSRPTSPLIHTTSVMNIGLIAGALSSSLIGRQFAVRRAPNIEYLKGIAGGILMGTGAALARGCNVGGFYSAIGQLSMGGLAMMVGLTAGAYIGFRYLIWEMSALPPKKSALATSILSSKEKKFDWAKVQPLFGIVIIIVIYVVNQIYYHLHYTKIGGLMFFGLLIGVTMHRCRFCFVRAFRCPFMTGDADMIRAVAMSLFIYTFGTMVIKWTGIRAETVGVYHPFWLGSLIGGVIFGIGMVIAGGCGSGTLWRAGEGDTKLWVVLVAFGLTQSLVVSFLKKSGLISKLGNAIYMPDVFTYQFSMLILGGILILWVQVTTWNEKTDKFVIF